MTAHTPPRRESIADHLATARAQWAHPKYPPWPVGAITVPFVEDLVRRGLIGGPDPVPKARGRGRGRRFSPYHYRSLLEVITLKLGGVKHCSGWLCHLWLRGREYPIEDVRHALIDEVQATIHAMMKDFAPTGRFTEPFGVKERRLRQPEGSDKEMSDFLEPLVAKMMRPDAISEINPNIERMAGTLAALGGVDESALRPAVSELVEGLKHNSSISADAQLVLMRTISGTPLASLLTLIKSVKPSDLSKMEAALTGAIDDGTGRSGLLEVICGAAERDLRGVRSLWIAIRNGSLEKALTQCTPSLPKEFGPMVQFMLSWVRQQRLTNRNAPAMAPYTFATYLAQW